MNETVKYGSKLQGEDKPWTRQELTVYTNGTLALAKAVIVQWKKDGCPKRDEQAIKYWKGIVSNYESDTGC